MRLRDKFELVQDGYHVAQIDFSVPGHKELLKRAHDEVYVPAFPIEDERDPLDLWMRRLNSNSPDAKYRYAIFVAGDDLAHPETCTLKGMSVGIYYREAQAGLMAYNAIAPIARGNGLGKLMVDLRRQAFQEMAEDCDHELRGIYLEINDPEQVDAQEDSYSPEQRERLFKRWGALHVPINYIQPALAGNQKPFERVKLMCYPLANPDVPTFSDVKRFLDAIYHEDRGDHYQTTITSLLDLSFKQAANANGPFPNVPVVSATSQRSLDYNC
jgi:hypothetical protein